MSVDTTQLFPELEAGSLHSDSGRSRRFLIILMFTAVIALLSWAAMTTLTGVTRATGMVVPSMQNQIVQHLEGGIVSQIRVKQGDQVEQGQVLLSIEDSQAKSTLQQTLTQISAKTAAIARIEAELADLDVIDFPDTLTDRAIMQNEQSLFEQHRRQRHEENLLLGDKIRQQEIALAGLKTRLENQMKEQLIVSERLDNVQRLNKMGAASQNELLQAMTMLQQINTKIDDLNHDIPQTEAALSEAQRERSASILKNGSALAEEKTKALVEMAQLKESADSLKDRTARTDVRAPLSGIVNKMMVSTIGGVISPGEAILEIVPNSDTIAIEAQLSPQDRAQIWPGTKAVVKVTAYDYSVYGGLEAEVIDISPDIIKEKDNPPYFRVRLSAPSTLGDKHPIIPGMMVNVDMITKEYTVLEYLLSPVKNASDLALRQ
ncbi:MAG: HlyD family type I secretion periplasmic adaptor subunit [Proteobacteria bacterium]|nr:HlyD family type I secretion periplasmic adaptor subunit [Pseudomonadota bacterium]